MNAISKLQPLTVLPGAAMPSFGGNGDIIVGIQEKMVNDIMYNLHKKLYTKYFNSSQTWERFNLKVDWDVRKAPVLRFEKNQEAMDILLEQYNTIEEQQFSEILNGLLGAEAAEYMPTLPRIKELLEGSKAALMLEIPNVNLKLTNTKSGEYKSEDFRFKVSCAVELNDENQLSFLPCGFKLEHPSRLAEALKELEILDAPGCSEGRNITFDYDKFFIMIVNCILGPYIMKEVKKLIPDMDIPEFKAMGFALVGFKIYTDTYGGNNYLLVSARVNEEKSAGLCSDSYPISYPDRGVFVLLNPAILRRISQKIVDEHGSYHAPGKKDDSMFYAGYSSSGRIYNPVIAIKGDNIILGCSLDGKCSVYGGVDIGFRIEMEFGGSVDAGFKIDVKLEEDKEDYLHFKLDEAEEFKFHIHLEAPAIIPAFVINAISDAVGDTIGAVVKSELKNIDVKICKIPQPEYTLLDEYKIRIETKDFFTKGCDGYFAIGSNFFVDIEV